MSRILIVDDEPIVRRSLLRVAEARGHEVLEAVDGVDGLDKWREMDPDLVFLDVLMPGLSGPEVLAKMGSAHRARVVLISAFTGEYDVDKARSIGADLFIPKPFEDIFKVLERVEELL